MISYHYTYLYFPVFFFTQWTCWRGKEFLLNEFFRFIIIIPEKIYNNNQAGNFLAHFLNDLLKYIYSLLEFCLSIRIDFFSLSFKRIFSLFVSDCVIILCFNIDFHLVGVQLQSHHYARIVPRVFEFIEKIVFTGIDLRLSLFVAMEEICIEISEYISCTVFIFGKLHQSVKCQNFNILHDRHKYSISFLV